MRKEDSAVEKLCSKIRNGIWAGDTPFTPRKVPFFYGWVIVFAATVGTLFSIPGQTMGFSVFTDILMEELKLSRVALSMAYFIGTVGGGFVLPWLGRVLDRIGERKMAVASSLSTGMILLYLSFVAPISRWIGGWVDASWQTMVSFIVIALGFFMIRTSAQGVLTLTCRNAVGKWFHYYRGMALAISGVFVSFGFSAAPRFLDALVNRFDYQNAWRILGFLTIGLMAPLAWLLFRDSPEESGLKMDGDLSVNNRKEHPDMNIKEDFSLHRALRTHAFWLFNLSFAFYALFGTAYTFHIVAIGEEFGFPKERIFKLFVPMAAVSVTTNLLFGWINPFLRLKYLLIIMNLGAAVGVLGLVGLNQQGGVAAYIIGNGIASGGFVSLTGIVWPRFYGRTWLGAISGLGMSFMVIGSGTGPLLFGWAGDTFGAFKPVLTSCLVIPVLLALAAFKADNPQRALMERT